MPLQSRQDRLHHELDEIFSPGGLLSRELPGFEQRSGQLAMARAVADAMLGDEGLPFVADLLLVEAGTGIGKTLAYLVPAALSGQKVVVSTGTLNLQDQILNKEIPFIREHIAPALTALCVKGRQNYLCLHRWLQFLAEPQLPLIADRERLDLLEEWAASTASGDRAELFWLADNDPLWQQISATNTQCLGSHCPEHSSCFINQLRIRAGRAQLLIVNHHLFFSDLALRRHGNAEVLPRYESVIFDEAHHLENVATQYFGVSFSHYQLIDLVQDTEKSAAEHLAAPGRKPVIQLARALASQADIFASLFPKERGRYPLAEVVERTPGWKAALAELAARFTGLNEKFAELAMEGEIWLAMQRRCSELLASLETITGERDGNHVYWFERRDKTILLTASPIEVAGDLKEYLYPQVRSLVFTSATLATGDSFDYFKERLGIDEAATLTLPTPYDYKTRTRLYIPDSSFPAPDDPRHARALANEVHELLLASQGRTLVLCTSLKSMYSLHDYLAPRLPFPLLMQGTAPKALLLETFQQETLSVLLAVASFWEGVDVRGESLSSVIIDKLPFEVPSDPVMMARINKIKEAGGNPFYDFQIPRAILTLRQGIGRLMRASEDRGILAVMDVRLFTKSYGRLFLKSLPPSPVVRNLEEVKQFFAEEPAREH